jgi:hypothetical protein
VRERERERERERVRDMQAKLLPRSMVIWMLESVVPIGFCFFFVVVVVVDSSSDGLASS